jgi:excinuclease UvrABC helicase subunit UvrB
LEQISQFELSSDFVPTGDQPQAIDALVKGVKKGTVQTSELEKILW